MSSIAYMLLEPKAAVARLAFAEAGQLDSVQAAAVDLYHRGLNVFPVPEPHEVQAWAAERPGHRDPTRKPPYLLEPLFITRLHLCDEHCIERQRKSGKPCVLPEARFEALFEGANLAAMAGRTSGNLVGLDCDTPRAFETVRDGLEERRTAHWAYETARGGGILLCLAEGEAANMPKGTTLVDDLEVWGHHHYMVLPPSVHWSGVVYTWLTPPGTAGEPPPQVSIHDLEWLGVTLERQKLQQWDSPDLSGLPAWTGALSRRNQEFLVHGVPEGDRNSRLFAAACDMAGCGVPYADAEPLILTAAARCDPPYPVRDAVSSLKSAYNRKRVPARKGRRADLLPDWQKAQAFAERHVWGGDTAQSDRTVFLAVCERARMEGRPVFRASEREVSELANRSRKTVQEALHRLSGRVDSPDTPLLLQVAGSHPVSRAYLYSFTELALNPPEHQDAARAHLPHYSPLETNGVGVRALKPVGNPTTAAEQDVFGRLGPVSWRVWQHLLQCCEPSGAAIARATGLNMGSVNRALRRLKELGLVTTNTADGHLFGEPRSEEELQRLAVKLGVSGRSEKRKREHKRERERLVNKQLAARRWAWRMRALWFERHASLTPSDATWAGGGDDHHYATAAVTVQSDTDATHTCENLALNPGTVRTDAFVEVWQRQEPADRRTEALKVA
jgi:hypothetical protein